MSDNKSLRTHIHICALVPVIAVMVVFYTVIVPLGYEVLDQLEHADRHRVVGYTNHIREFYPELTPVEIRQTLKNKVPVNVSWSIDALMSFQAENTETGKIVTVSLTDDTAMKTTSEFFIDGIQYQPFVYKGFFSKSVYREQHLLLLSYVIGGSLPIWGMLYWASLVLTRRLIRKILEVVDAASAPRVKNHFTPPKKFDIKDLNEIRSQLIEFRKQMSSLADEKASEADRYKMVVQLSRYMLDLGSRRMYEIYEMLKMLDESKMNPLERMAMVETTHAFEDGFAKAVVGAKAMELLVSDGDNDDDFDCDKFEQDFKREFGHNFHEAYVALFPDHVKAEAAEKVRHIDTRSSSSR